MIRNLGMGVGVGDGREQFLLFKINSEHQENFKMYYYYM